MTVASDPTGGGSWRPRAGPDALRRRARLLAALRAFFARRGVLEVETPVLGAAAPTDPHLTSVEVPARERIPGAPDPLYLQTSPESAMKRLLAAGSGPIYQIGRAFRGGERGRFHNPEFTLLEWYRPGFDHRRLVAEVESLLAEVAGLEAGRRTTYRAEFARVTGEDPLEASPRRLRRLAAQCGLDPEAARSLDADECLDLVFARRVQPVLGAGVVTVEGYPATQAAQARLDPRDPRVAARFEVFVDGLELANGYHELTEPGELRRRMERDLARRRALGRPPVRLDERLLAALEAGMPEGAGVALGVDRLLMVMTGAEAIDDVIAFPVERA